MEFLEFFTKYSDLHDATLLSLHKSSNTILAHFTSFDSESLDSQAKFLFSEVRDFFVSEDSALKFFHQLGNSEILDATVAKELIDKTTLSLKLQLLDYKTKKRDYLEISFAYSSVAPLS
jgi:hypothetical protein